MMKITNKLTMNANIKNLIKTTTKTVYLPNDFFSRIDYCSTLLINSTNNNFNNVIV